MPSLAVSASNSSLPMSIFTGPNPTGPVGFASSTMAALLVGVADASTGIGFLPAGGTSALAPNVSVLNSSVKTILL